MSYKEVTDLLVHSDERIGDGGFLTIRRTRLQNRRNDGSLSDEYVCDFVVRPRGDDAVVVLLFRANGDEREVLLRRELRPALELGREDGPGLFIQAVVAGLIEAGDKGESGRLHRAAAETHEEAGFRVDPQSITRLGPPMYVSPGAMVEKFHFYAVRIEEGAQAVPLPGDGSPMEEGARTEWVSVADALARCDSGEICDLKTELILRRFAARD